MKVLMISVDASILEAGSKSAARMKDYGSLCEELRILVLKGGAGQVKIAENVYAESMGNGRIGAVCRAIKAGGKILSGSGWIITAQDPFETGFAAWRLAKRFKAPFEVQMHGDFYGNGYWRKESILNRARFHLGKFILRRAHSVRVVSERIKRSVEAINPNIAIVPIRAESPKPAENFKKNPEEFVIFGAGGLIPVKNHKMLIEIFSEIKKALPAAKLVIAGEGPLRGEIESQIADYKLQDNVRLAGHQDDLVPFYQSADIFVQPSLYEGWGRAVVEAAQFGLPIVMSDVGLAGEVIKDGESGIVVPVNDEEAFKNAIIKLAKDETLRKKLGEGARQAVSKLPGKEEYLNKIKAAWEALI